MSQQHGVAAGNGKADGGQGNGGQHPDVIPFHLDGELEKTAQAVWTPNDIIRHFGQKDPARYYLTQTQGPEKGANYKDMGDVPITIRPGDHFVMVSIGATTVSDGNTSTGVAAFMQGLRELGYDPQVVPNHPAHIYFDYLVPVGKFAGMRVRLGFQVPPDFPFNGGPTGPHVSPHVLPLNQQGGAHPSQGVHPSPFSGLIGGDWQYWSRPFPDWASRKKTVATYMSHIYRLWETQ